MSAVVNVAKDDIRVNLYDADGVGRAGLTVTVVASRKDVTVSATDVTDRGSGAYDATITFTSVGTWQITATATIDGDPAMDVKDIAVVTAAQADPAAATVGGETWTLAEMVASLMHCGPERYRIATTQTITDPRLGVPIQLIAGTCIGVEWARELGLLG